MYYRSLISSSEMNENTLFFLSKCLFFLEFLICFLICDLVNTPSRGPGRKYALFFIWQQALFPWVLRSLSETISCSICWKIPLWIPLTEGPPGSRAPPSYRNQSWDSSPLRDRSLLPPVQSVIWVFLALSHIKHFYIKGSYAETNSFARHTRTSAKL